MFAKISVFAIVLIQLCAINEVSTLSRKAFPNIRKVVSTKNSIPTWNKQYANLLSEREKTTLETIVKNFMEK